MESLVLIGYFPRKVSLQTALLQNPAVEEICSVSECISPGPDDWINHWRHNPLGFFDTPDLAWSSVVNMSFASSFVSSVLLLAESILRLLCLFAAQSVESVKSVVLRLWLCDETFPLRKPSRFATLPP